MADGNVHTGKQGSPNIRLALWAKDYDHILKFAKFIGSTHKVISTYTICRGKKFLQYTVKFPSRVIAAKLASYGVVPKKSLIAKVIWRGVVDGDGYLEIRNGQNTDRIVVLGSYELVIQFKEFIETNIPNAYTNIIKDENIHRLIVYSNTARNLNSKYIINNECQS
jgi:hypothetical protein